MSVLHDFECAAHGHFEKRVTAGKVPRCPKGCSSAFVKLVHLKPVRIGNQRYKNGDRLLREAADMQGLTDISTSPSRPGGTVAQRNRMRNRSKLLGPQGHEYPREVAAKPVDFGTYIGAMTMQDNALTRTGFGHAYDKSEWKKDEKTGAVVHEGAKPPVHQIPLGTTGVSIERVKEKAE